MSLKIYQSIQSLSDPLCQSRMDAVRQSIWPMKVTLPQCAPCTVPLTDSGCFRNCFKFSFPGLSIAGSTTLQSYGLQEFDLKYFQPSGTSLAGCFWMTVPSYAGDFTSPYQPEGSPNPGGFGWDCSGTPQWRGASLIIGPSGYPPLTTLLVLEISTTVLTDGLPGCSVDVHGASRALAQGFYTCNGDGFVSGFRSVGGVFAFQGSAGTGGCTGTVTWPASLTVVPMACSHC